MSPKTNNNAKKDALHLYLTMNKVKLNAIAQQTGVDTARLKEWRDTEDWPGQRAKYRATERKRQIKLATVDRCNSVLHSCDAILRLLTWDLGRFAREVDPDQHQMVRLMHIIRDINHMAYNAWTDLHALENQIGLDESAEARK